MSSATVLASETLADLVARLPAAARVLHRHRLDFCCGGERSLAVACGAQGLDAAAVAAEIVAEIDASGPQGIDWSREPLSALAAHIVTRYHEDHRTELPRLRALAAKVEQVHADHPANPRGLAEHLAQLEEDMIQHMAKEEGILFPALLAGRGAGCAMPVRCMMEEHEEHGRNLARTRALAHGFVLPAEACGSWRALYQGLERLERDLMAHVHLENHVLFPRGLAG